MQPSFVSSPILGDSLLSDGSLRDARETLRTCGLPVYLYGTGNGADKILDWLSEANIPVRGVFASDGFVRDRSFRSFRVESLQDVTAREGRIAAVLCFGLEGPLAEQLLPPIVESGHLLLAPALPVYGDGCFDRAALQRMQSEVDRVYGWLADPLSRTLYEDVLRYTISGDPRYLRQRAGASEPPAAYYARGGVHVDVGAYDGDTALEYLSRNPLCEAVHAFEPNEQTYRKLYANAAGKRVICHHAACSDHDGQVLLSGSGRGNRVADGAQNVPTAAAARCTAVECCRLDTVCGYPFVNSTGGLAVGSLKIDAEGEDAAVLRGAANLITARKCAICVSAYHRAHDLVELPLLLKRLHYRGSLFFRKKPYVPAWDTMFYLV